MNRATETHDTPSPGASRFTRWFLVAQRSLLLAVIGWFLIVEVGLRLVADPDPVLAVAATQSVPHPYLGTSGRPGWSSEDGRVQHDARGFRTTGTAPAGDAIRIACLGGAATYGADCTSDGATWPARLRMVLQEPDARAPEAVDVVNAGFPGWTTFEVVQCLAFRVLDLNPDLVVLQVGADDVGPALFGQPLGDNSHWRTAPQVSRPAPLERWLQRSITYRLARGLFSAELAPGAPARSPRNLIPSSAGEDPLRVAGVAERGVRNFERNLRTAIGVALEHGVEVVILPQFVDSERLEGRPSAANQVRLSAELVRIAERVARELGVVWIEVDPERFGDGNADESADRLARLVAEACRQLIDRPR